jgi:GNAT superfamily N-acetyltransferase
MGGFVPTAAGHADERAVADDGTGTAELHRMRVAPPRQREGHGQRLLERLETQARALGFQRLLATTSRRQTAAVAFYPAHGYRQVDESTHGEYDLVHFEKSLSDGPTGDRSGASDAA